MATFARWCYRHRIIVVVAWVLVLLAVVGAERAAATPTPTTSGCPAPTRTRALTLLSTALPSQSGDTDQIVWHVRHGSVNDPQVQARIKTLLAKVAATGGVNAVQSPYSPPAWARSAGTARRRSPRCTSPSSRSRSPRPMCSASSIS